MQIWLDLRPSHEARFSRFTLNLATAAAESVYSCRWLLSDCWTQLSSLFHGAPAALADRPGAPPVAIVEFLKKIKKKTERNVRNKFPPHRIDEKHISHDVPMCPSGKRLWQRLNCIVNRLTKVEMKKEHIPLSLQIGFDWSACRPTKPSASQNDVAVAETLKRWPNAPWCSSWRYVIMIKIWPP